MRGSDRRSGELFSYVDIEERIRADHPLRTIKDDRRRRPGGDERRFRRALRRQSGPPVDAAGDAASGRCYCRRFYSIRSERQLMERLEFDLLFRWFVGLSADEAAWDHSTFTKNRDRLLDGEIAARFLGAVLTHKRVKRLLSTQHFSADGTLIEAWASLKSFKPKDDNRDDAGEGDDDPPDGSFGDGAGGRKPETSTSRAPSARTKPIARPPTLRRCSTARGRARRPSSASSAMR